MPAKFTLPPIDDDEDEAVPQPPSTEPESSSINLGKRKARAD